MTRMVMENSGLVFWPVLSLFIFGGACFAMVLWVFRKGSDETYRRMSVMALDDSGGAETPLRRGTIP